VRRGALTLVPPSVPGEADRRLPSRAPGVLRRPGRPGQASTLQSLRCHTAKGRSGPDAVLAYLSRYTHRVAIANSRLVAFDGERVTFKWKDYRAKADARDKLMTLDANEFIRRFLIHVLPDGFHRIRHYGLFANGNRANNIALARRLLGAPDPARWSADADRADGSHEDEEWNICPCCGGRMVIVETFGPGCQPRLWPIPAITFDSS